MPLIVPNLDDRSYSDILNEALARISVHNPEWTNFNDSDPGVTLLQLFSFMTENLLYRSNLIPERNHLKFLQLIGMSLRPAAAAQGVVTISNERGPLQTITLPANIPVLAGKVGFVTQNALDVLPIDMRVYIRKSLDAQSQATAQATYTQLYSTFADNPANLDFYETVSLDPPTTAAAIQSVSLTDGTTVDGSLWLALLVRTGENAQPSDVLKEIAGKTITLGLMPSVQGATRTLPPEGSTTAQPQTSLLYQIATGKLDATNLPVYAPLNGIPDNPAGPLQDLTLVQLTLPDAGSMGTWSNLPPLEDGAGDFPPTLEDTQVLNRLLTWIRVSLPDTGAGVASSSSLSASFSWAGINAARVTQRVQVIAEPLGSGTGEPDQAFNLINTPVIPETVQLAVNGERWTRIDDLLAAPPEVPVKDPTLPPGSAPPAGQSIDPQVFAVDRESGRVRFGTGLKGARPPAGSQIIASYAYGGGRAGNVGIGSIQNSPQLPAGFKVSNPLPTWGGDEGETPADAERNIPLYLKTGQRAVSSDDFTYIVQQTPGINLGRVEVLPVTDPGVVTLLVIPVDPQNPQGPTPNRLFLDSICNYLEPRRLLTTEVIVQGPTYVGLSVSIGMDVVPGRDIAPVREAVKQAIRDFLSPLTGGPNAPKGTGWPLSKAVESMDLWVQAVRVDGVSRIRGVTMWDSTGAKQTRIEISGLELPRLDQVGANAGDPEDLTAQPAPPAQKRVPVPVLPATC